MIWWKRGPAKHAPNPEPEARDPGAEPRTAGCKAEEERAVHRASPPSRRRHTPDGVLRAQTQGRTRRGRGDMAGLRGGTRAQSRGPPQKGPPGSISAATVSPDVHTEGWMVGKGRWRSQLWRRRSSRAPASWCSTPSTRRISLGSHTGFDPGEGRTMRWMLCRWRSPVGE